MSNLANCDVCGAPSVASVLAGGNGSSSVYRSVCDAHNPMSLTPTFRDAALADEALALLKRDEELLGIAERDYFETGEGDRGMDCGLAAADIRALLARADREAGR